MNYRTINTAILTGNDIPKSLARDSKFYEYLLDNSVAYYYSSNLSKEKKVMDKKIINAGSNLNNIYFKTLNLINKISKENKIKFLLFKTYKYVPEAVDNDIDLFIKGRDFFRFMKALEKEGFNCLENERLKGICTKEGFCNIEPRVNSEFHELVILNEKKIWDKIEQIKVGGIKVFKVTKEVDLLHLLLSVLYNPNYLKLYVLLIYKDTDIKNLYGLISDGKIKQDLALLIRKLITKNFEDKRFPLFIGDINFMIWWFKRIFPNSKLALYTRLKHILFFFYMKYSYILFNRLVFKHKWSLN